MTPISTAAARQSSWPVQVQESVSSRSGLPFRYGEVFEMSEYGAQLTSAQLREMFPVGSIIPEREISEYKC